MKINRCSRCNRRMRSGNGWNVDVRGGYVTGFICPGCQTPEENAEAVINEATTEYGGVDPYGRIIGRPKHDA